MKNAALHQLSLTEVLRFQNQQIVTMGNKTVLSNIFGNVEEMKVEEQVWHFSKDITKARDN